MPQHPSSPTSQSLTSNYFHNLPYQCQVISSHRILAINVKTCFANRSDDNKYNKPAVLYSTQIIIDI